MSRHVELPPLAARVVRSAAGAFEVLTLPTPIERVISFAGSFRTDPDFAAEEEVQQQMVVSLLDKGTQKRDRFELAEALDDRGAQLSFSADGLRSSFSGRCLSEDLGDVMALIAEQLREPLFDEDEFQKARSQQVASVRRIMDDTGSQAHGVLARRLYDPAHPNYRPTPEVDLAHLQALTIDHVRDYHQSHFGARDAVLVLSGDVDPERGRAVVEAALGDWHLPTASGGFEPAANPSAAGREDFRMEDRFNLDVRMGHALPLRRDHPDYLALYVAVYILGGNFSARLMSTVRDEMGLTYGIGARLAGVAVDHDAYFLTSVTLSQDRLEEGIEATLEQIRGFVADGITQAELEEKQSTIAGSFKVGLATTRGLAGALLANAERGFPVDYLDRFPRLVQDLTVDQVNEAIRQYLDPDRLHIAVAGTLAA